MSEKKELSKLDSMKKCPFCGGELEKGYVISGQGISWYTKEHKLWAPTADRLSPKITLTIPNLPSLRCKQCSIVIFDYSKYR
jgi:hypothetical protein